MTEIVRPRRVFRSIPKFGVGNFYFQFFVTLFLLLLDNVRQVCGDPVQIFKCCQDPNVYSETVDACVYSGVGNGRVDLDDQILILPSSLISVINGVPSSSYTFGYLHHMPRASCSKGNTLMTINLQNDTGIFTPNGYLIQKSENYSPSEYCVANDTDPIELVLRVCIPVCGGTSPCIKKCCPLGQAWNVSRGCVPMGEDQSWTPDIFQDPTSDVALPNVHPHYTVSYPGLWCDRQNRPALIPEIDPLHHTWKFRIDAAGEVYRKDKLSGTKYLDKNFFCVDGNVTAPSGVAGSLPIVLFDCLPIKMSNFQPLLYGALTIISSVFLFITVVVRLALWDKQANHRWTLILISYCMSLFFMYIFFAIRYFWFLSNKLGSDTFCYVVGVASHFSFLTTFCWLTAISFDHWWTFKKVLKSSSGRRHKYVRSFLKYAAFPLIVATTIVSIAVILDVLYGNVANTPLILPNYTAECFLDPHWAQLYYAYGPAGILLVSNIFFFGSTIYNLYQAQRSTKIASENCSKNANHRQSAVLVGKLLVVMGVPWVFEVVSWVFERNRVSAENPWYWLIFDVINALQGVAIFWIFVCHRGTIRLLDEKFGSFKKIHHALTLDESTLASIQKSHPNLFVLLKPLARKGEISHSEVSKQTCSTEI